MRPSAATVAAFAAGLATSVGISSATADADATYRNLAVFARVLNYVEHNYVDAVEPPRLIYGAIRGMLATLDPHSTFMEPEQYAAMKSEARGEFGGIGVEIVKRDSGVVVVERYPDSPAVRAGLRVGDRLVAVGGEPVDPLSLAEVVRRIKGRAGTPVVLSVIRGRDGRTEDVTLVRDRIRVATVDSERFPDGVLVLRIKSFTERTYHDLRRALDVATAADAVTGVVLDMRDNPGGLLDEAVRVADTWLDHGVIVTTEGRGKAPETELAHPKGTEPPYPMTVLVNGGTASAAEIVAGALQDHGRARVLGTQTFGKGTVQTIIELEDRSALKLTIARYLTPNQRSIQGTGITPDMVVPVRHPGDPARAGRTVADAGGEVHEPTEARDNQLDVALRTVREALAAAR